jgi:transposase InsO family protein
MPFPVQRVQTDRGGEFFADEVQDDRRKQQIKFRPNRPRAPHLNGKSLPRTRSGVERVQRTALEELWPTVDPKDPDLAAQLEAWRTFYNHHRPHSALGSSTPAERIAELAPTIPTREAVQAAYDPGREPIRSPNTRYRWLPTNARVA